MNKKISMLVLVLTLILMLSGCAGFETSTNTTDYDDGFYHGGKGKTDGTHRY